jgi:uncharacterized membrane protein YgdD (TMEM256/DUF423 family)
MHTGYLKTAALLGALSVALGAFAAHGLKKIVSESAVTIFETGVRYQFYHVFGLLAVAILYGNYPNQFMRWAGLAFIIGTVLFSGSLYLLTYKEAMSVNGLKWVGPVTPLGGLAFIAGWVMLFLGIKK